MNMNTFRLTIISLVALLVAVEASSSVVVMLATMVSAFCAIMVLEEVLDKAALRFTGRLRRGQR